MITKLASQFKPGGWRELHKLCAHAAVMLDLVSNTAEEILLSDTITPLLCTALQDSADCLVPAASSVLVRCIARTDR